MCGERKTYIDNIFFLEHYICETNKSKLWIHFRTCTLNNQQQSTEHTHTHFHLESKMYLFPLDCIESYLSYSLMWCSMTYAHIAINNERFQVLTDVTVLLFGRNILTSYET